MKINANFSSFTTSAKGMSAQKRKMDLIAENIANSNTTRAEDGQAYKRKFMTFEKKGNAFVSNPAGISLAMRGSNSGHVLKPIQIDGNKSGMGESIEVDIKEDSQEGARIYMPDHPDSDTDGYLDMPNVNVVTEMVDMIAATRTYEANLTAFNASKNMAKSALEMG